MLDTVISFVSDEIAEFKIDIKSKKMLVFDPKNLRIFSSEKGNITSSNMSSNVKIYNDSSTSLLYIDVLLKEIIGYLGKPIDLYLSNLLVELD